MINQKVINKKRLEEVFNPKENTPIKEIYFLGLPKDV
jgi:hypothetical protein